MADPQRDVVLQYTHFTLLQGRLEDYHLYVLLAPHLGNRGDGNMAWIGDYKGVPMLFAERGGSSLALACSAPWLKRSAGFVGASDGWQDLARHRQRAWTYAEAETGNVTLTGEVALRAAGGRLTLALGFGRNLAEARHRVEASLWDDFVKARAVYVRQWQAWQQTLPFLRKKGSGEEDPDRISLNTVRVSDALPKVETPYDPAWHRYNNDGYGEHEDGAPFDGIGIGQAWSLLKGERAHHEPAADRGQEAGR